MSQQAWRHAASPHHRLFKKSHEIGIRSNIFKYICIKPLIWWNVTNFLSGVVKTELSRHYSSIRFSILCILHIHTYVCYYTIVSPCYYLSLRYQVFWNVIEYIYIFKNNLIYKTRLHIATLLVYIIHVWHTLFRLILALQLPIVSVERNWHLQHLVQYIWVIWINLDGIKAPLFPSHKVKEQYNSTCGYLSDKK